MLCNLTLYQINRGLLLHGKNQKILVAVDMSKHSENALDYALFLAQKCEAELVILNVFDSFERVASSKKKLEEIAERLKGDSKEQLARYADRARTSGVKNVRVERVEGDPAKTILKVSRQKSRTCSSSEAGA